MFLVITALTPGSTTATSAKDGSALLGCATYCPVDDCRLGPLFGIVAVTGVFRIVEDKKEETGQIMYLWL